MGVWVKRVKSSNDFKMMHLSQLLRLALAVGYCCSSLDFLKKGKHSCSLVLVASVSIRVQIYISSFIWQADKPQHVTLWDMMASIAFNRRVVGSTPVLAAM